MFITTEHYILNWIQFHLVFPEWTPFWIIITHLGDRGLIWIVFTIVLLAFKKTRAIGRLCALSLLCSLLITNAALKELFARARPFELIEMDLLISAPVDHSFPSGHTSAAFAFAFVLLKERFHIGRWPLDRIALTLASLMAFSRLYFYVHYPSDVLGGIIIGYICSVLSVHLMAWLKPRKCV